MAGTWKPPSASGSSLAFEKPVVTFEIAAPVSATENPPKHQVFPMVSAPVDMHIAHFEACPAAATLEASKNDHGDKSFFSYHLALENVTDEIVGTIDVERPSILEPVLQVEIVPVPFTVKIQQHKQQVVCKLRQQDPLLPNFPISTLLQMLFCTAVLWLLKIWRSYNRPWLFIMMLMRRGLLLLCPRATRKRIKAIKPAPRVLYQLFLNEDFMVKRCMWQLFLRLTCILSASTLGWSNHLHTVQTRFGGNLCLILFRGIF